MGTVPVRVFNYSAQAIGVSARYTGADGKPVNNAWASVVLPVVGGDFTASAGAFNDGILSFNSARAHVSGSESAAGVFTTKSEVEVTGLSITSPAGGSVSADTIAVSLTLEFRDGRRNVHAVKVQNTFTNLAIGDSGGATQNYSNVEFERALAHEVGSDHGNREKTLKRLRPGKQHHIDRGNNKAYSSLAKDGRLRLEEPDYGRVDVAGLGAVYFGEWVESEDREGIMGLRIVFSDPARAVDRPDGSKQSGEIVIGNQLGGNGSFYP